MLLIAAILISKLSPRAPAFESDATKWCGFPRDVSLGNLPRFEGFLSIRLSLRREGILGRSCPPQNKASRSLLWHLQELFWSFAWKRFKLRGILQYGAGEEMRVIPDILPPAVLPQPNVPRLQLLRLLLQRWGKE